MKKEMKRLAALLLSMAVCMSLACAPVWAGELTGEQVGPGAPEVTGEAETVPETSGKSTEAPEEAGPAALTLQIPGRTGRATVRTEGPEEDLFLGYLEQMAQSGGLQTQSAPNPVGSRLEGIDAALYSALLEGVRQVAAGERASTQFEVPVQELMEQTSWYAEDLEGLEEIGLAVVDGEWTLNDESRAAMDTLYDNLAASIDFNRVLNALMADCPYELYWYAKTADTYFSYFKMGAGYDSVRRAYYFYVDGNVTISLPVSTDYAGEEYTVDTSLVPSAQEALNRAEAVVQKYAAASDFRKLNSYRQEICEMASYNTEAGAVQDNQPAQDEESAYGNPWQLIWVFDDDPETKVVCEGYSKAFQLLCDLSTFSSKEVYCRSVTGLMTVTQQSADGPQSGPHMWNIVHWVDEKNYLVDVTNCDGESIGEPDLLFLSKAESGSVSAGYTCVCGDREADISFQYDTYTLDLYDEDELTLSKTPYEHVHVWDKGVVTQKPTAEKPGTIVYTCTECYREQTKEIAIREQPVEGDFDGDYDITMSDVVLGIQAVVGNLPLTETQRESADVTGDGDYTMVDVVKTNRCVLGKISTV